MKILLILGASLSLAVGHAQQPTNQPSNRPADTRPRKPLPLDVQLKVSRTHDALSQIQGKAAVASMMEKQAGDNMAQVIASVREKYGCVDIDDSGPELACILPPPDAAKPSAARMPPPPPSPTAAAKPAAAASPTPQPQPQVADPATPKPTAAPPGPS